MVPSEYDITDSALSFPCTASQHGRGYFSFGFKSADSSVSTDTLTDLLSNLSTFLIR
jgi:hypothetical protein